LLWELWNRKPVVARTFLFFKNPCTEIDWEIKWKRGRNGIIYFSFFILSLAHISYQCKLYSSELMHMIKYEWCTKRESLDVYLLCFVFAFSILCFLLSRECVFSYLYFIYQVYIFLLCFLYVWLSDHLACVFLCMFVCCFFFNIFLYSVTLNQGARELLDFGQYLHYLHNIKRKTRKKQFGLVKFSQQSAGA
jgi:hypothetical protein